MAANLEVLSTADRDRWMAALSEVGLYDFYHLPEYHEIAERAGGGEGRLLVHRQREHVIALPMLIRRCGTVEGLEDVSSHDATSVYGYAGPIGSATNLPGSVIADFQSSVRDALGSLDVVSLFSSLNPLIPQASLIAGLGESTPSGSTVSLDLTLSNDAQLAQFRDNHVRDIRKLRALGATGVRNSTGSLEDFVPLYNETMVRLGAKPHYFFDQKYFDDLAKLLGSKAQLFTCILDGKVIAAGLFLVCGDIVQYHLSGTRTDHVKSNAMKLVLDTARQWASAAGMRTLHLGGGLGAQEDSLFHFKSGFSDRRHTFSTWRWVVDQEKYDRITAQKIGWNARNGLAFASGDYFPRYRGRTEPSHLTASIEIQAIRSGDADLLGRLLPRIDGRYFQPHPMTVEESDRIAALDGRDVYLIGLVDDDPVVYGMLRGWDEGYPTASVGVGVRHDSERRGFGRAMMEALHDVARRQGATELRLRVHPDNHGATALYRSLGYEVRGMERGEILMTLDL